MKSGDLIQTIGKLRFFVTRGTDSKGVIRRDWFMSVHGPRGRYTHFTGFATAELAADYARTFKEPAKSKGKPQ